MAEYRLEFSADSLGAENSIKRLRAEIRKVTDAFEKAEIGSQDFIDAASDLSVLDRGLKASRNAVVDLEKAYKDLGRAVDDMQKIHDRALKAGEKHHRSILDLAEESFERENSIRDKNYKAELDDWDRRLNAAVAARKKIDEQQKAIMEFRAGMGARGAIPGVASPIEGGINIPDSPSYAELGSSNRLRKELQDLQAEASRVKPSSQEWAGFQQQIASIQTELTKADQAAEAIQLRESLGAFNPSSLNAMQAKLRLLKIEADNIKPDTPAWKALNKEIQALEKGIQKVNRKPLTMGQRAGAAGGAFLYGGGLGGGVGSALGGIAGGLMGGVPGAFTGAAVGQIADNLSGVTAATASYAAEIDKQRIAIRKLVPDNQQYQQSLQFIAETSKNLAIPQEQVNQGFTRIAASVIGAGGNVRDAQLAFDGIAAGIRGTGGSLQDMQGALLATAQVFSKGKVSAEELRGQIGERLPGAFTIFAQAIGKTPQELDKMLEKGEVGLNEFMVFIEALSDKYGQTALEMADSTQAAGDRLTTTMSTMREQVGRALQPLGAEFQEVFDGFIEDSTPASVGAARLVAGAAGILVKALKEARKYVAEFGIALGALAVTIITAKLPVIIAAITGAIQGLISILAGLGTVAAIAAPWLALAAGLTAAGIAAYRAYQEKNKYAEVLNKTSASSDELVSAISKAEAELAKIQARTRETGITSKTTKLEIQRLKAQLEALRGRYQAIIEIKQIFTGEKGAPQGYKVIQTADGPRLAYQVPGSGMGWIDAETSKPITPKQSATKFPGGADATSEKSPKSPKTPSMEGYHSLQDQLAKNFTEDQIRRIEQEYQARVNRINAEFDIREARANSFHKEAIQYERKLSEIALAREKAVMDASNEVLRAREGVVRNIAGGSAGAYLQGNIGPTSTGPHFDVKRVGGGYFPRNYLDPYVMVNGKPLSSGTTVPGGTFAGHQRRGSHGWDYAFGSGRHAATLTGGAQWMEGKPTEHGERRRFKLPSGEIFQFLHGKSEGIGAGTPRGKVGANERRDTVSLQKEQLAIAQKSVAVQIAEIKAVQDAAVAWAQYSAAIAPIEEQQLQNSILAKKNELMKAGMPEDAIDKELKYFEAQEKTKIGIDLINKLLGKKEIKAEEAAKQIKELQERLAQYNIDLAANLEIQKQQSFDATMSSLRKQLDLAGIVDPREERRAELIQGGLSQEKANEQALLEERINQITKLRDAARDLASSIGDAFGNAFKGMITGSMTVTEALSGMFKSIADSFADMAAKMIADWMRMQIIGLVKKIFSFLPGMGGKTGELNFADMAKYSGFANGGVAAGGFRAFANGGIVQGPTLGLVGEGRYNEAIVPLPDGRSIPVQMQGGSSRDLLASSGAQSSAPPVLSMNFQSTTINGVEYVDRAQLEAAMQETRKLASRDGASRGASLALDRLQNSPSTRRRVGIR